MPGALVLGLVAFLAIGVAVGRGDWPARSAVVSPAAHISAAIVVSAFLYMLWATHPHTVVPSVVFAAALVLAGGCAAVALAGRAGYARWALVLLAAGVISVALWRIAGPPPPIDVWHWHREALSALFDGRNPYAISMPNIYDHDRYYGPGLVSGTQVLTGYQYPPLSLALAVPGHVFGDYRYGLLAAWATFAFLLKRFNDGQTAAFAVTLWVLCPVAVLLVEMGWTDLLVVLALATTVVAAHRRSRWTFVALGVLFAVKQYTIVLAPLVWLLPSDNAARWRPGLMLIAKAGVIAALTYLPFVVWDADALVRSVVTFHRLQPFRADSLSLAGWLSGGAQLSWPDTAPFIAAGAAAGVALWRQTPSIPGFCVAVAFVLMSFFATSKQAFINYYAVVFAALLLSLASACSAGRPSSSAEGYTGAA